MELSLIINIILLVLSISMVALGAFRLIYPLYISKKYSIGYLEVQVPYQYHIAFWAIVIPFVLIFLLNSLVV